MSFLCTRKVQWDRPGKLGGPLSCRWSVKGARPFGRHAPGFRVCSSRPHVGPTLCVVARLPAQLVKLLHLLSGELNLLFDHHTRPLSVTVSASVNLASIIGLLMRASATIRHLCLRRWF